MTQEISEPFLTLEELQQFFEERVRVLNVSPIGEEAGLSRGHLNRILKGERGLTQKQIVKLLPVLYRHGYDYQEKSEDFESTLTLEQLHNFFEERKSTVNVGPLGEDAGLPKGYLTQIMRGDKGLSQKTVVKLLPILRKYGYKE